MIDYLEINVCIVKMCRKPDGTSEPTVPIVVPFKNMFVNPNVSTLPSFVIPVTVP